MKLLMSDFTTCFSAVFSSNFLFMVISIPPFPSLDESMVDSYRSDITDFFIIPKHCSIVNPDFKNPFSRLLSSIRWQLFSHTVFLALSFFFNILPLQTVSGYLRGLSRPIPLHDQPSGIHNLSRLSRVPLPKRGSLHTVLRPSLPQMPVVPKTLLLLPVSRCISLPGSWLNGSRPARSSSYGYCCLSC